MNRAEILQAFEAEVRARPVARAGFTVEAGGGLVRLKGPFEFISWWTLTDAEADAAVAAAVAGARQASTPLYWRVFDHDGPPTLSACLKRHGLIAEPPGALMVFDLGHPLTDTLAADHVEVQRAATPKDVDDHLAVTDAVFDDGDAARLKSTYDTLLGDPHFSLFTAYADGRPVASGRLETGPDRQFGSLFGGGVRPGYRGQGLYRALVQARADQARTLGLRYLATEAVDASRPILERLGFIALAREVTWVLS